LNHFHISICSKIRIQYVHLKELLNGSTHMTFLGWSILELTIQLKTFWQRFKSNKRTCVQILKQYSCPTLAMTTSARMWNTFFIYIGSPHLKVSNSTNWFNLKVLTEICNIYKTKWKHIMELNLTFKIGTWT
jgi:hypothetical protein